MKSHAFSPRRLLALFLAIVMAFGMTINAFAYETQGPLDLALGNADLNSEAEDGEPQEQEGDEEPPYEEAEPIRIDLLTFADFHGHTARASVNDADPGAALFVAYAEWLRYQNPNPNNVFFAAGGDEFHGYALANFPGVAADDPRNPTDEEIPPVLGDNVVAMMQYLVRDKEYNFHVALGNHEFSHGIARAYTLGEQVTLLAADIFYAQGQPEAGQRPDFVRSYDIITFPDHDITIGMFGLMNTGMRNLVSGGLAQFDLRFIQQSAPQQYKDDIHDLIEKLREYYGVSAVVALTHKGGNSASINYLADNFDVDAIIGGHVHQRVNRTQNGVPIIEAGFHGRSIGRFTFDFDQYGELETVTPWLSPVNAIRDFAPRAAGEVGVDLGAHAGHQDWQLFSHHYDAMQAIIDEIAAPTALWFGAELGVVGMDFTARAGRDVWVTRLNHDYIVERIDDQNLISVSNSGGWRNTGLWPRTADDVVIRREIYSTMPFNNLILIHQMYGRDVITMLNSMGTNPRTGVHGTTNNWYITATGERIVDAGHGEPGARVYNVSSSNHTWDQDSNTWRFPGNPGGSRPAAGRPAMHVISEPEVLLRPTAEDSDPRDTWTNFIVEVVGGGDPTAGRETTIWTLFGAQMLRYSMEITTNRRGDRPIDEWSSEITVSAVGTGTAAISMHQAHGQPTNQLQMGTSTRVVNPQRVTVIASGEDFRGWFVEGDPVDAEPLATTPEYTFTAESSVALEARFGPQEPIEPQELTITLQAIADFHGMMNSTNAAADPGFARFVTFMDGRAAVIEEETGYAPVVLHAGDAFFGQSLNNLFWGEPALWMLNRVNVRYGAVGNHEFSWQNRLLSETFGQTDLSVRKEMLSEVVRDPNPMWANVTEDHILNRVEAGIPFIAADVVYATTHPNADLHGTHPDWIAPYAIIDGPEPGSTLWYDDYGVRVALIGLTHPTMEGMTGPMDREHLDFNTPFVTADGTDMHFEWLEEMITMLRDPEGLYGVSAVVILSHVSSGGLSNNIVDRLQQRGNAFVDGFFSGHTHNVANVIRTYGGMRTAVVLGPHHGRGHGQISLDFIGSELVDVRGGTFTNIIPNQASTHVRAMAPDPEVFRLVHGEGATWARSNAGNATTNLIITYPQGMMPGVPADPVGDTEALLNTPIEERGAWGWEQLMAYSWGQPRGPRGTYASGSQHHRNQFLVNLLLDYVNRVHPDYIEMAGADGVVIINNQSAWRGQSASELTWGPEDQVSLRQLMAGLTFENTMPLFEMRGRDMIEMLNMAGGAGGPGVAANQGSPGRWPADHPQWPNYPNWNTLQGSTVAGAFFHDGVWHLAATLEPITEEGIYLLGASNHLFGGYGANGGQHWPLPGNNHGNALGFHVRNFVDDNDDRGAAYSRGPRFAINDGTEGAFHITIQETWVRETTDRAARVADGQELASWIEVRASEGGTAALHIWGHGTRTFPGASNHSGWGNPSYPGGGQVRDLVLHGHIVRATATRDASAPEDYVFLGWFANNELVSEDAVFVFASETETTLYARFGTEEPPVVFSGSNPIVLRELLLQGDVVLTTRGNLGIFAHHSPFVIPAGRTLTIESTLNVSGNAQLIVEGTLVVAEGGRINNQGGAGGTIKVLPDAAIINNGHVENVTNSSLVNEGTIENNNRFEIRANVTFRNTGHIGGTTPLNINRHAIIG